VSYLVEITTDEYRGLQIGFAIVWDKDTHEIAAEIVVPREYCKTGAK